MPPEPSLEAPPPAKTTPAAGKPAMAADAAPAVNLPLDTETTAVKAVTEPEDKSPAASIDRIIAEWRTKHIAGGAIARTTEAFNHLQDALPKLAAELKALF